MTPARVRLLTDEQMAIRCAYAAYGTYRCARQPEHPYHAVEAVDSGHPYQAPSAEIQCVHIHSNGDVCSLDALDCMHDDDPIEGTTQHVFTAEPSSS